MAGNSKIPFTKYEAALLLDAYLQAAKGSIPRREAIAKCSQQLRQLGKNNGIRIDEIYRNVNGITFQMESMESAYVGHTILKPASRLFNETVELYRNDNTKYERILMEAKQMSKSETVSDAFINWLSKQVSPAQLSELYMAYIEVRDFAIKENLIRDSLWDDPDPQKIDYVCAMIRTNRFFTSTHKRQMSRINSVLCSMSKYAHTYGVPVKAAASAGFESREEPTNEEPQVINTAPAPIEPIDNDQNHTIKAVNFAINNNMAFTKPVSLAYFGEITEERSWVSLYKDVCRMLAEDYPNVFREICMKTVSGSDKLWVVNKANIYKLAKPVQMVVPGGQ